MGYLHACLYKGVRCRFKMVERDDLQGTRQKGPKRLLVRDQVGNKVMILEGRATEQRLSFAGEPAVNWRRSKV